jgi:hypothetical protein
VNLPFYPRSSGQNMSLVDNAELALVRLPRIRGIQRRAERRKSGADSKVTTVAPETLHSSGRGPAYEWSVRTKRCYRR